MKKKSRKKTDEAKALYQVLSYVSALPLPPELLERIFWHLDEQSFLAALLTCKHFWVIGSARHLVLRQIKRIPGIQAGLEEVPTPRLFLSFRVRAAEAALGATFQSDVRSCPLPPGSVIPKSVLARLNTRYPDGRIVPTTYLALACEQGTVKIYMLTERDIVLLRTLSVPNSGRSEYVTDILYMAFSEAGCLAILYKELYRRPFAFRHKDPADFCKVFLFELFEDPWNSGHPNFRPVDRSPYLCIGPAKAAPTSIAVSSSGRLCISWTHISDGVKISLAFSDLEASKTDAECNDLESKWTIREVLRDPISKRPNWITEMHFSDLDSSLVFYEGHKLGPIGYSSNVDEESDETMNFLSAARSTFLLQAGNHRPLMTIWVPFFATHWTERLSDGTSRCNDTYLTLGCNKEPLPSFDKCHLFVLRLDGIPTPGVCTHTSVDPNDTMQNTLPVAVALLAGWQSIDSSLGTPLAASQDGCRVAAARWDRVMLWTLSPDLLCHGPLEAWFPNRDYNHEKRIGRIRPVELPSYGVVHKLHWIDSDNLVALTDRGITQWYVGINKAGRRNVQAENQGLSSACSRKARSTTETSKACGDR